jgi:hypothetical protein
VRVLSATNPEYQGHQHKLLWLLIGGDMDHHRATAYFLGPDHDQDGDNIAGDRLDGIVLEENLTQDQQQAARRALERYRGLR